MHNSNKVFKFKRDLPDKDKVPSEFMSRVDRDSPNAKLVQLKNGKRHLTIYNNYDMQREKTRRYVKKFGLYSSCLGAGFLAYQQILWMPMGGLTGILILMHYPYLQKLASSLKVDLKQHARFEIIKIDLVMNWFELDYDFVSRHVQLETSEGETFTLPIESISPIFPRIQELKLPEKPRDQTHSPKNYFYSHLDFFCESRLFHIDTRKADYAINRHLLRAVMNGFHIDMYVPCIQNLQKGEAYSE